MEIPLGPSTVLVGPNGCGKTSVLEAMRHLGSVTRGLDHAFETKVVEDIVRELASVDWLSISRTPGAGITGCPARGGAVESGGRVLIPSRIPRMDLRPRQPGQERS